MITALIPTPADLVADGAQLARDMLAHAEQALALANRYTALESAMNDVTRTATPEIEDQLVEQWCADTHYHVATRVGCAGMTYLADALGGGPLADEVPLRRLQREVRDAIPPCGCDWAAAENHDQLLTWLRCDTASDLMAFIDGAASWHDDHEGYEPVVHPEHWIDFAQGHDLPNVNLTREALWRARISMANQQLAGHAPAPSWMELGDMFDVPTL